MVNNNLETIHRALLYMAKEFDQLCRTYKINYSVDGGTMIGIIRHKGFIPWDDDFDVHMLRDDYEKFINLIESGIDSRFRVITWDNTSNYYHGHAKLILVGSEISQASHLTSDETSELFIDIFPLDNAPENSFQKFKQKWICYCLNKIVVTSGNFNRKKNLMLRVVDSLLLLIYHCVGRDKIISLINHYAQEYNDQNTNNVAYMTGGKNSYERTYSTRQMHNDTIYMPFENIELLCLKEYGYLLKKQFGNYMEIPPKESRKDHQIVLVKLPKYLEDMLGIKL